MARPRKDAQIDLSEAHDLTAGLVERLTCPPGKTQAFMRDKKAPGLRVRVTASGAKSYVFEAKLNRQTIRSTIGNVRAWGIEAARAEANRLRVTLDAGTDPREVDRQQLAQAEAKRAEKLDAEQYTLKNLLAHYCDHLKKLGRPSHKDARSIFKLHVNEAWPKIAALPANQVTYEHVADMMRRLLEIGKGRTSNKLRSYVRSAYQVAKVSRSKASIPLVFKSFNIINNPAADTEPDESQNRADKNPLSAAEMRAYWQSIKLIPGFKGAVLRLHLLIGGQRIEQLVNLLTINVGEDLILIYDGKGRPGRGVRSHHLPLIPQAKAALQDCEPQGVYALSTQQGRTHLSASTFSNWATAAATNITGFEAKRIRSGVETILASVRVSKDDRGRVQSHGISGVQDRHYDGYDYLDEKRHALEMLFNLLDVPEAGNVVPLHAVVG